MAAIMFEMSAAPVGGAAAAADLRLAIPRLSWTACDGGFACATAWVPLDYNQSTGAKVGLALGRLPAGAPAVRFVRTVLAEKGASRDLEAPFPHVVAGLEPDPSLQSVLAQVSQLSSAVSGRVDRAAVERVLDSAAKAVADLEVRMDSEEQFDQAVTRG